MSEKQRSCMKKLFVKISRRPYGLWDIFYETVCVCLIRCSLSMQWYIVLSFCQKTPTYVREAQGSGIENKSGMQGCGYYVWKAGQAE